MIRVVEWTGGAAWDAFVGAAPYATVMHLYAWKAIIERAYGHRTFFLAAQDGDELCGVLPLVLVRGAFPGRHLVSMPFMDYGGACVGGHDKAEATLADEAVALAQRHRAVLTLRCLRRPEGSLPVSLQKVTMLLTLGRSESDLWKRLPSERRNRIRKGQKQGVEATFHGAEELEPFYRVFSTNMRDLGSPVHGRRFFQSVMSELPDHTRLVLVRWQGHPIGAGLMLLFNGTISIPWVSSLRQHFEKCPNQILYWEAMRFGIAEGFRTLDFGRSSVGSGTFEAKRQWGAEPVQLYWAYSPESGRPPGAAHEELSRAVKIWTRLPLSVANTVGPWLRRAIPN